MLFYFTPIWFCEHFKTVSVWFLKIFNQFPHNSYCQNLHHILGLSLKFTLWKQMFKDFSPPSFCSYVGGQNMWSSSEMSLQNNGNAGLGEHQWLDINCPPPSSAHPSSWPGLSHDPEGLSIMRRLLCGGCWTTGLFKKSHYGSAYIEHTECCALYHTSCSSSLLELVASISDICLRCYKGCCILHIFIFDSTILEAIIQKSEKQYMVYR